MIAQLPATSKGQLNKRVFAKIDHAPFDSEIFIGVIETLAAALPDIGPRRLANNALSLIRHKPAIDPEPGGLGGHR